MNVVNAISQADIFDSTSVKRYPNSLSTKDDRFKLEGFGESYNPEAGSYTIWLTTHVQHRSLENEVVHKVKDFETLLTLSQYNVRYRKAFESVQNDEIEGMTGSLFQIIEKNGKRTLCGIGKGVELSDIMLRSSNSLFSGT